MQITAKKISDRRKYLRRIGRANLPRGRQGVFLRCEGYSLWHSKESHLGIVGRGNFLRRARRSAQRVSHVGLAGGDPHFAEQYVFYFDNFLSAHTEGERSPCMHRRQQHLPTARCRGSRLPGVWPQDHCDPFFRISPAPDGNTHVFLKNHVIGKKMGKPRLRLHTSREQNQREKRKSRRNKGRI